MTVTSTVLDREALTLTYVCEYAAPLEAVWQMWADPRRLERWWAPAPWHATFFDYDLRPDGRATYVMAGPDGTKIFGWWRITAVEAPRHLTYDDGFADEAGNPDKGAVSHGDLTIESRDGVTVMRICTSFDSLEDLEELAAMGMEEGMGIALSQIDALLQDVPQTS